VPTQRRSTEDWLARFAEWVAETDPPRVAQVGIVMGEIKRLAQVYSLSSLRSVQLQAWLLHRMAEGANPEHVMRCLRAWDAFRLDTGYGKRSLTANLVIPRAPQSETASTRDVMRLLDCPITSRLDQWFRFVTYLAAYHRVPYSSAAHMEVGDVDLEAGVMLLRDHHGTVVELDVPLSPQAQLFYHELRVDPKAKGLVEDYVRQADGLTPELSLEHRREAYRRWIRKVSGNPLLTPTHIVRWGEWRLVAVLAAQDARLLRDSDAAKFRRRLWSRRSPAAVAAMLRLADR
jgi:hypothetical protein